MTQSARSLGRMRAFSTLSARDCDTVGDATSGRGTHIASLVHDRSYRLHHDEEGLHIFEEGAEDGRLEGTLWGEPVDVARHAPACEPKGATYTALRVAQDAGGSWSAACIVDV